MFMKLAAGIGVVVLSCEIALGQGAVKFDVADIHPSPRSSNPDVSGMVGGLMRGGRYELLRATMPDLISKAYGIPADKVIGGPSWLEMDRFDIAARGPGDMTSATAKLMLRSLLSDRFQLVVHRDKKPLPAFALTAKKAQLKQSGGSGDASCKSDVRNGDGADSVPTVTVTCANASMAYLANALRSLPASGQYLGGRPVADQTGLEGAWDFSFHYDMRARVAKAGTEIVTMFDALEKQLGIAVQPSTQPADVLVVDSVSEKPSPNSPESESALRSAPAEFEVATVKSSDPAVTQTKVQVLPGGRIEFRGVTLKPLIEYLWGMSDDMVFGAPKFADSDRWDIVAKTPPASQILDASEKQDELMVNIDTLIQMEKQMLADRFKLAVHLEERPMQAYTLISIKPKMKKADPSERTHCTEGPATMSKTDARDVNPVLGRLLTCYNTSMAQLADQLQKLAGGYVHSPILDSTDLEGGYDFTINFSTMEQLRAGARNGPPLPGAEADDPNGAVSLPDAVEKQLGLKMSLQKRPVQVLVIDHLEQTPTDN